MATPIPSDLGKQAPCSGDSYISEHFPPVKQTGFAAAACSTVPAGGQPCNKALLNACYEYQALFKLHGLPLPPPLLLICRMTENPKKPGKALKKPVFRWKNRSAVDLWEETVNKLKANLDGQEYGGLALATGEISGVWVTDVDESGGGFEQWDKLVRVHSEPVAWKQHSPNNGMHFFHKYQTHVSSRSKLGGHGIDVRCNGGIIIIEPSFNEVASKSYKFERRDKIETCPEWLLQFATAGRKNKRRLEDTEVRQIQPEWGASKYPTHLVPYFEIDQLLNMISPKRLSSYDEWLSIGLLLCRMDPSEHMFNIFSESTIARSFRITDGHVTKYTRTENFAKWREFCKAADCKDPPTFPGLIRKAQEDSPVEFRNFMRHAIFNMHCDEVWLSHSTWYKDFAYLALDALGQDLLDFKCQMYLRKTVAPLEAKETVILQKKRCDNGEFFYQVQPYATFKARYGGDVVYYSKEPHDGNLRLPGALTNSERDKIDKGGQGVGAGGAGNLPVVSYRHGPLVPIVNRGRTRISSDSLFPRVRCKGEW